MSTEDVRVPYQELQMDLLENKAAGSRRGWLVVAAVGISIVLFGVFICVDLVVQSHKGRC